MKKMPEKETKKKTSGKLIAAIAVAVLIGGPAAVAQTGGVAGSQGGANQTQSSRDAPVGHRQPRADQVPSEKNLSDPNNPANKEDLALDRKIKSICRGC
jgi:hypothetical protein